MLSCYGLKTQVQFTPRIIEPGAGWMSSRRTKSPNWSGWKSLNRLKPCGHPLSPSHQRSWERSDSVLTTEPEGSPCARVTSPFSLWIWTSACNRCGTQRFSWHWTRTAATVMSELTKKVEWELRCIISWITLFVCCLYWKAHRPHFSVQWNSFCLQSFRRSR